jgi:hypothetical protein
VHIEPTDGSRVPGDTILVAELRYRVDPFVEGRYFVTPQFATTRPGLTSSGDLPRTAALVAVNEASGLLTISVPIAGIRKDKEISKPLELPFCLNEWLERRTSHTLARTVSLHYIAE